jgi:hypothetical protein
MQLPRRTPTVAELWARQIPEAFFAKKTNTTHSDRKNQMSIKTILESLFRLAVIACLSLTAPSALSKEMQSTVIQLEAIPQISKAALSKKGITYQINEPIAYIASENIAIYDVEILIPQVTDHQILFTGDGERFNAFVAELDFIKENSSWIRPKAVASGLYEGVKSLVTGLWDLVRHPIETGTDLKNAGGELLKYAKKAWNKEVNPMEDVKKLAYAAYVNLVSTIASDAHFSYEDAVTIESRNAAEWTANSKISGRFISETAMLLLPMSEIKVVRNAAKVGGAAKGIEAVKSAGAATEKLQGYQTVLESGNIFTGADRILNSLKQLARTYELEAKLANPIISSLVDPAKLSTLRKYAANQRLHKVLYHLYQSEKSGGNLSIIMEKALQPGVNGSLFYSQKMSKAQILNCYQDAKNLGIFDNVENLEKMRRGISPIIIKGEHAGKIVHVDHIIPIAHAPELGNNFANLRYASVTENTSRGASIDKDAISLIEEMKTTGWQPAKEFSEKLAPTNNKKSAIAEGILISK